MSLLIFFAFLAGVVTVLSPCILPVLPLILSSSLGGESVGKSRPIGVVVGFIASFTLFTLFLSSIVSLLGIAADSLRLVAIAVVGLFGISLLVPRFQIFLEQLFSRFSGLVPRFSGRSGFGSGFFVGLSLGLLWTPCVGPILASVISLALTGSVTLVAFFITLAYASGTAIPMLLIIWGGRELLHRVPWLLRNTARIQRGFGIVMVLIAVALSVNLDRRFQTYVVNTFPRYGIGLTRFEERDSIREELARLSGKDPESNLIGKPTDFLSRRSVAPELISGGAWINSKPLTLSGLRGKVVIVDFWTYSCINCQRTLPYLKRWNEKYADKGLVIIGVHAPEFEFEKDEANVREAIADFGLKYPVMQDNNFATWRAYDNHYWPAKYFIDRDGYIRFTHFGEGAYDESERVIQYLLAEAGAKDVGQDVDNPEYTLDVRTPETYLGYGRLERFSSPERIVRDQATLYASPERLPKNSVAYSGEWTVTSEYAHPSRGAALQLDFESKEVFLVMRSRNGAAAQVRVSVDNQSQYSGADVHDGIVTIHGDRLYRLIRLPESGHHILKLEFLDDNVELYAFTFG